MPSTQYHLESAVFFFSPIHAFVSVTVSCSSQVRKRSYFLRLRRLQRGLLPASYKLLEHRSISGLLYRPRNSMIGHQIHSIPDHKLKNKIQELSFISFYLIFSGGWTRSAKHAGASCRSSSVATNLRAENRYIRLICSITFLQSPFSYIE